MSVEAWLRGPVEGIPPLLMPVAHALQQAREELRTASRGLPPDVLWQRPGGAASVGFHLRHIAGSLDRLLTYARGEQLAPGQLAAVREEGASGEPPAIVDELLARVDAAIDAALDVLAKTDERDLLAAREVGRARLPSNVLGLLFHAAEHTQRHTGQVIATSRILMGAGRGASR